MNDDNTKRVICINTRGYPASLTENETYTVLADFEGAKHGLVRIIDDSGEDYLYPASSFMPVESSEEAGQQSYTAT